MTKPDEPFSGLDITFKASVETSIQINGLLTRGKLKTWGMIIYGHMKN